MKLRMWEVRREGRRRSERRKTRGWQRGERDEMDGKRRAGEEEKGEKYCNYS